MCLALHPLCFAPSALAGEILGRIALAVGRATAVFNDAAIAIRDGDCHAWLQSVVSHEFFPSLRHASRSNLSQTVHQRGRTRHHAAAAEHEHIAAAAVSKRISELEENLKIRLLIRTNKGIQPTPAGIALSTMARRALHELDEIAVQMRDYASGLRGFIRVHANISAITQFLPQDIRLFLNECPNVQVDLEEKISSAIIKSVAENAADVGIISGRRRTTTWRFILTVKTRWRWWCRTAIPAAEIGVSFCRCAGLRLRWTAPGQRDQSHPVQCRER